MTDPINTEPLNLFDYEALARDRLSDAVYGYYASGAGDEITVRENRAAYDRLRLRPRMLRDVTARSSAITLWGERLNAPVIVAPMAYNALAHPEGELAVARAAGTLGLIVTHSTLASYTMEQVAQAATGALWYQLYAYHRREINQRLIERAERAGYRALVVTVDTPIIGRRETDIRTGFSQRRGVRAVNLLDDEMRSLFPPMDSDEQLAQYVSTVQRANLTWDDVAWLKGVTRLPLLLKGILRGDDARRAVDLGADGIVISNHGGRQLDSAIATIDALPEIAQAVGGQVPLIVDGGVRRGTDIVKALALGAQAVMVGRPVLWGLAHEGESGARRVLRLLLDEFDLALALCGACNCADLTPDLIARL